MTTIADIAIDQGIFALPVIWFPVGRRNQHLYYKRSPENKNKLVIDIEVADIIKLIFNLYEQGNGVTKIAQILSDNDIGIRNIEVVNNRVNNYGALKVIVRTNDEMNRGYDVLIKNGYDVKKVE